MPSVPVLFTLGRQDFFNAPEFQRHLKLFNNLLHQRLKQCPLSVIAPSEFALTAPNKTKSQWNNQETTSSPLSSTIFSNFNNHSVSSGPAPIFAQRKNWYSSKLQTPTGLPYNGGEDGQEGFHGVSLFTWLF